MSLDPEVLRSSFELVTERQPELTKRFYEILFQRYPQVRPLFSRTKPEHQNQMLQSAFVAVLENLENANWLAENLTAMGKKHVEYGTTDEMYDWVGDALLTALAEAAGNHWTPQLKAAWTAAYGAISGLMKQGAREGRAA